MMKTPRLLVTQRCGVLDMRLFRRHIYISLFGKMGNAGVTNRGTVRKGVMALSLDEQGLARQDRSFPFELDDDDTKDTAVSGKAFECGSVGLAFNSEIPRLVATPCEQVLCDIPAAVRGPLGERLLQGWVIDDNLDASERLHQLGDAGGQTSMRDTASGILLEGTGQPVRLKMILAKS